MDDSASAIVAVLARARDAAGAPPPRPEPDGIVTRRLLHDLAARGLAAPTRDERTTLDALCHRLSVAGEIRESYLAGWRADRTAASLDPEANALLAAVLVAAAMSIPEPGPALKALNAAFTALDLAGDAPDHPLLERAAARRLREIA